MIISFNINYKRVFRIKNVSLVVFFLKENTLRNFYQKKQISRFSQYFQNLVHLKKIFWQKWRCQFFLVISKRKNEIVKENSKLLKICSLDVLKDSISKFFEFLKIDLLQIYDALLGEVVYKKENIKDNDFLSFNEILVQFNKTNFLEFQLVSDEKNQYIYIFIEKCFAILRKSKDLFLYRKEINNFLSVWCYIFRKIRYKEKNKIFITQVLKCRKIEEILMLIDDFLKLNSKNYQLFIYNIRTMEVIIDKKYEQEMQQEIFSLKFENQNFIFNIEINLFSIFDLDLNFVKNEMEKIFSKKF